MDWTRFLLRMTMWIRHPPSKSRIRLILIVLALCLVVFAIERLFGRPDWMQVDRMRFRH